MAKNIILRPQTARDIEARIDKVLKGLGNPEPPIDLQLVRELLKLDKAYYTSTDDGVLRETVSRIKIASIQVLKRPAILLDVVRKFSLRALYLPDRKRILLDNATPPIKHRWDEAHEITHSLLPWHEDAMMGDNKITVSPGCHDQMEAEANYGAGQLLFCRERFASQALDMPASLDTVKKLKGDFKNTYTSTLWRYVDTTGTQRPLVGMITCHPHVLRRPADFDANNPCKHFIQSQAFARQFSKITEIGLFNVVARYCGAQRGGMLGQRDLILTDDNGDEHLFYFETFYNRYEALTLGVHQGLKAGG